MIKDGLTPDYWETQDARQGGIIAAIDENGLLVHTPMDMRIGGELRIRIFYSVGNEFDELQASTKIVGKDVYCNEGWEAYEYELEISEISEPDRVKLNHLLNLRELRRIYS